MLLQILLLQDAIADCYRDYGIADCYWGYYCGGLTFDPHLVHPCTCNSVVRVWVLWVQLCTSSVSRAYGNFDAAVALKCYCGYYYLILQVTIAATARADCYRDYCIADCYWV